MNVAFIGLGLMGAGMAANLLKAGHAVRVHTRTKEKAQALLTLGANWANTPRAAATGATVAITMLAHPAAVEAMAIGDAGLLAGLAPGTVWIDSTTVSPRFSRLMFDESSQRAVRFIDAPVLGSKQPAREARLVFLVGGDKVDVASVEPLLLSMGREVRHLGPIGSGSALKLVFNHLLGTSMATRQTRPMKATLASAGDISMHSIQCACGALRGSLTGTGTCNRVICYCTDCRAFARFLGRADTLDDQGGTEIVQVAQSRLTFWKGDEQLSAVRLGEKGMVRWYASCCKTPIGNTMADPRLSFIGLIHSCLDRKTMDQDFGRHVALANTETALGEPKLKQRGLLGVIARFVWIVASGRLSGRYKQSALFSASGSPRVEPGVLRPEELERLKSTA